MVGNIYVLGQTYDEFEKHGLKDTIEAIREEFANYKSGDEFEHSWFCHDVGADPGNICAMSTLFQPIRQMKSNGCLTSSTATDTKTEPAIAMFYMRAIRDMAT